MIRNPILPGFHPDPSILRVGEDYYLATSTFEWLPGVRLHHSRDLVHWRPLGGVLTEPRLLDLTGTPDSGGVWAPCLSYADGVFYVVFTNVAGYAGGFWDVPNHVVTATSIEGPWSDPVPLHARGFDPSLFHDEGGRSWLLSNDLDWRPGHHWSAGIIAQEFDRDTGKLLGEPVTIFSGTPALYTEGPHIYRRDGWYYLLTAEGGTGWDHQVTVARSRSLLGPYQVDPVTPLLSAAREPRLPLQKAGHGSLVQTPAGQWYLAYLVGRPLTERDECVLGRETALAPVHWTADGWPRIEGARPALTVPAPDLPAHPWPAEPETDDFAAPVLGPQWSTLRRPFHADWASLHARPGHLRLHGGRSPSSKVDTSLVARRVTAAKCTFTASVEADPRSPQQLAGITAYYNTRNWHYAYLTWREGLGRCLELLSCGRGRLHRPAHTPAPVPPTGPVHLRADLDLPDLRFSWSADGDTWHRLGSALDARILSDEHAIEASPDGVFQIWGFTGAFLGLWSHDLSGNAMPADFAHATYTV
ncbi:glycoside hydrolase family 43 protein [Catellatospora citrea]|uniref:Xylan 1,4-beta-xylosidase n=1 Tax=Catellatospora citrea TaxID=53366 RepID=A0A8J3NZ37_9ACTN|nr:glycoside hydrolase family 43 protein [Catellatospora citrea]RKE10289.1 xylan 1,4-beta-xylosidase [Catellatospora citrea]GIF97798.1 xylan 1,4-beta-xylosidase [Catellatospora citrea]